MNKTKRLLSLMIACAWLITAQAQYVFTADLDVAHDVAETNLNNSIEEFRNWDLADCIVGEEKDIWRVNSFQVNHGGHATTPSFSITVPKVRVSFYARAVNTNDMVMIVSIVGNDGQIDIDSCKLKTQEWKRFTRYITNASNIKLRFEGAEGADRTFQLYKLTVENHLFYESFDQMDGSNDNFVGSNLNIPAESNKLDNKNTSINAKKAKRCIFISNNESYQTAEISASIDRSPIILAFRAARDANDAGAIQLSASNGTLQTTDFTPEASTWHTYRVPISIANNNLSKKCRITFKGKNYFLDEVKLYYPSTISLNETSDNTSVINLQIDEAVNASLTRTLTGGYWNTLCLPFAINQEMLTEAVGSYNKTEFRILEKVENNSFYFKKTETVPAGTPCLMKPTTTVTNPTFKGVTIEATEPQNTLTNGYGFYGTFSPIELATDHTNAFLSSDQLLYYPAVGKNTMNGMRAYFVLPAQAQGTRVHISDANEQNSIKDTYCPNVSKPTVYDLSGRRIESNALQKGLYIVNGKKTIIK